MRALLRARLGYSSLSGCIITQPVQTETTMGDRANIVVYDPEFVADGEAHEAVFLYSHWGGSVMPATLKVALQSPQGKARWGDAPYLARIIFCEMVKEDIDGETGYGISSRLTDNEYPLLVVNVATRTVTEYPEDEYHQWGFAKLDEYPAVSFVEYTGEWKSISV